MSTATSKQRDANTNNCPRMDYKSTSPMSSVSCYSMRSVGRQGSPSLEQQKSDRHLGNKVPPRVSLTMVQSLHVATFESVQSYGSRQDTDRDVRTEKAQVYTRLQVSSCTSTAQLVRAQEMWYNRESRKGLCGHPHKDMEGPRDGHP